ncbi:MAG: hypothetical protein IT186_09685 [Acidobacteria bacterium]|nr:hypothetical protein [Acidobacteriota bacterium]
MPSDIDLVVESAGSNSFRPFSTPGVNTQGYDHLLKLRNLKRTLLQIRCGADADLAPNLKDLLAEVDTATGGDMARLGTICLYGTSNGAGLILAFAKALQDRGAPRIRYIGLGDLTMMPFGRNPAVPGIGNLQPVNAPPVSFGLAVNIPRVVVGFALPPSMSGGAPPRIADPGVLAERRENYFTVAGNRARVFSMSPAGANSWWWTSTQNFGEVHGEIPGWDNIPRTTTSDGSILTRGPGSIDEKHHDNLCGMSMPAMQHQAGLALTTSVAKLP